MRRQLHRGPFIESDVGPVDMEAEVTTGGREDEIAVSLSSNPVERDTDEDSYDFLVTVVRSGSHSKPIIGLGSYIEPASRASSYE